MPDYTTSIEHVQGIHRSMEKISSPSKIARNTFQPNDQSVSCAFDFIVLFNFHLISVAKKNLQLYSWISIVAICG